MNYKEELLRNIMARIGGLDGIEYSIVWKILVEEMDGYNIDKQETLPAVDTDVNEKLIKNFLIAKKIEGLKETSLKSYAHTIKRFLEYSNVDLLNVNTHTIRMFLLDMGKSNSTTSVDNYRRNLSSFFSWMVDEEYISRNPIAKIKKVRTDKKLKLPYTDEEIVKIKDNIKNKRERAMVDILLSCGLRCNELCNITLDKINFTTDEIVVMGKGHKERTVYMNASAKKHTIEYLESKTDKTCPYLFSSTRSKRLSNGTAQRIIRELGQRSGVEDVHIHRFRRHFCCELIRRGCDIVTVQTLMGHSNVSTTNIYITANNDVVKSQCKKYI